MISAISREIARAQGYVDRLLGFESENEQTRAWFETMQEEIWTHE